ncbi:hypothetical protein E2C01_018175 [Portunus trituberculatus]|uniref:Uncharacterized protein n=1 Tax=Portunus trituberculatus TaxID=210409 RepID=A0A5B7DUT8_PORTR|nr:hypothetical protein [Portunus trituberculatus]
MAPDHDVPPRWPSPTAPVTFPPTTWKVNRWEVKVSQENDFPARTEIQQKINRIYGSLSPGAVLCGYHRRSSWPVFLMKAQTGRKAARCRDG